MADFVKPTVQGLLKQLNTESYLPVGPETNSIIVAVRDALESMEARPEDYRVHVDMVHRFMRAVWKKYDCEDVYIIMDSLTRVEPALLDLERDPEAGKRYRDHYVHVFHVFVLGLRIISEIIGQLGDKASGKILKVANEQLDGRIKGCDRSGTAVSFRDYPWKERLFFLWTLISTLHDIATPITHLENIRRALNAFSERFHLEITGPSIVPSYSADLDNYLWHLSRLFGGKLEPSPDYPCMYRKANGQAYIKAHLERLMHKNHGVLGGFLAYKTIEGIFLNGRSEKYRLDAGSFDAYRELVLQEDIARVALAISLHAIEYDKESRSPGFLPLQFNEHPLSFMLILTDSLQEYLRWEGRTIRGDTKLTGFPSLSVKARPSRVEVDVGFSIADDPSEQKYFCEEVVRMMGYRNWPSSGNTVREASNDFCRMINEDMGNRIAVGQSKTDRFTVRLHFFEGVKLLCTQTLITPRRYS